MKKTLKSILAAFVWLTAMAAHAHQPDLSTFTLVEQQPGNWMLVLNASLTAFQQEVRYTYGEDSYTSPEEFNKLVIKHLKDKVSLNINGREVALGNGLVKLGHATTVAFKLSGVPADVSEVYVKNAGFQDIHHSQVVFSVVKNELGRKQFILSEENNYQAHLALEGNQIELVKTSDRATSLTWLLVPGIALMLMLGLYLACVKSISIATAGIAKV
ncbi:DUF6702 family protein [Pontibacter oryzae]|nr:DUF6702 family protein [Pontibacter oryzae]